MSTFDLLGGVRTRSVKDPRPRKYASVHLVQFCFFFIAVSKLALLEVTDMSVSYTHLDVYKRQRTDGHSREVIMFPDSKHLLQVRSVGPGQLIMKLNNIEIIFMNL